MRKMIVIGGHNAGLTAVLLQALSAHSTEAVIAEPKPIKIKAANHKHLSDNLIITKPKHQNFVRFQNNFKRNRR